MGSRWAYYDDASRVGLPTCGAVWLGWAWWRSRRRVCALRAVRACTDGLGMRMLTHLVASHPLRAQVPPGVDSGSRLRVRGEGNAGRRGGESGEELVVGVVWFGRVEVTQATAGRAGATC